MLRPLAPSIGITCSAAFLACLAVACGGSAGDDAFGPAAASPDDAATGADVDAATIDDGAPPDAADDAPAAEAGLDADGASEGSPDASLDAVPDGTADDAQADGDAPPDAPGDAADAADADASGGGEAGAPCGADVDCAPGTICGAGHTCEVGCTAQHGCAGGATCCGGQCVDTGTSPLNCGACGHVCPSIHGAGFCSAGDCSVGCDTGWSNCNGQVADGCESHPADDVAHCGGCATPCAPAHATGACAAGVCSIASCATGWSDCNQNPADGCEAHLAADPDNCGACHKVCSGANASQRACVAGACAPKCEAGFGDCSKAANDGCEADLLSTESHCGSCAVACTSGVTCAGGQCTIGSCPAGTADCDQQAANGCERSITTTSDCGACGNACTQGATASSAPACASGACSMTCFGEKYDVNGSLADGCELQDSPTGHHTQGTASYYGSQGCTSGTFANFTGTIPADGRSHAFSGFDAASGSAPDWFSIYGTGAGLCSNDYGGTFSVSGGSASSCYQLAVTTDGSGTSSWTTSGTGGSISFESPGVVGQYSSGSYIYVKVSRVCSTSAGEAPTYSIDLHL